MIDDLITKGVDVANVTHLGRSPTIAEIAAHVGASESETLDAMELGNAYETVSLDTKLSFEGETAPLTLNDSIGGDDNSLWKIDQYDDLKEAVERLFRSRGAAPCGGGP